MPQSSAFLIILVEWVPGGVSQKVIDEISYKYATNSTLGMKHELKDVISPISTLNPPPLVLQTPSNKGGFTVETFSFEGFQC